MPMTTMLAEPAGAASGVGHSPERVARDQHLRRRSRRRRRLRTSGMVPVWQKEQVRLQPTWVETHSAPRSSSGMKTRLDLLPVGEAQQPLARAVGRDLLVDDHRPRAAVAPPRAARAGLAAACVIVAEVA